MAQRGCVLVVDDDDEFRETVQSLLEEEGWTVRTAADGPEALGHLRDGGVSLLLLDLGLPGGDGLALLDRWRGEERDEPVPVVVVSADPRLGVLARGRADIEACLSKPVRLDPLLAAVSRHARRGALA